LLDLTSSKTSDVKIHVNQMFKDRILREELVLSENEPET
jgi:hypothetical protein